MFATQSKKIGTDWKLYYSTEVIPSIKCASYIWENPSQNLLDKTNEIGCYQYKYSDMEKYISYKEEHIISYREANMNLRECVLRCFFQKCSNCIFYNFPCINAIVSGNLSNKLLQKWKINHFD